MRLFKQEDLECLGGIGEPGAVAPGVQLVGESQVGGGLAEGVTEVGWGTAGEKEKLEWEVFSGATVASGADVC